MDENLMEFSINDGDITLAGDENMMPPVLAQTPVVVNSILKPSTKDNLIQLITPVHKNHKVKFQTPQTPRNNAKKLTPTRFEEIKELDDKENWKERTIVITKEDHAKNITVVKEVLDSLVSNLPLYTEKCNVVDTAKEDSGSEDETFFDATNAVEDTVCEKTILQDQTIISTKEDILPSVNRGIETEGPPNILSIDQENINDPFKCRSQISNSPVVDKKIFEGYSDPFKPSQQLVNSPDVQNAAETAEQIQAELTDGVDPFKPTTQIQNSPTRENSSCTVEEITHSSDTTTKSAVVTEPLEKGDGGISEIEDLNLTAMKDDLLENIENPFVTKTKVANSPSDIKKPAMLVKSNDPVDTVTMENPFETKSKVGNSPVPSSLSYNTNDSVADAGKECLEKEVPVVGKENVDVFDPLSEFDKCTTESQVPALLSNEKDGHNEDPFVTKSNVANSPLGGKTSDPFGEKKSDPYEEKNPDPFSEKNPDPFGEKNSDPFGEKKSDPFGKKNFDPFATNSIITNSPPEHIEVKENDATKSEVPSLLEVDGNAENPFATKSKVANSPPVVSSGDTENPFATSSKIANSPSVDIANETDTSSATNLINTNPPSLGKSSDDTENPFATKSKVANSPSLGNCVDTENPFATKLKVENSPSLGNCVDTENPFATKSNVANSPSLGDSVNMENPFATKSKVVNSPSGDMLSEMDTLFATKSDVTTSSQVAVGKPPHKESQAKNTNPTLLESVPEESPFETENNVTTSEAMKRDNQQSTVKQGAVETFQSKATNSTLAKTINEGQKVAEAFHPITDTPKQKAGPINPFNLVDLGLGEDDFKPASEDIFSDPSAFDILEQYGSATGNTTSNLDRMSLYVKFDPLVNLPPGDPRRASIDARRMSIMEKRRLSMKGQCFNDQSLMEESLMLMGTPPQRRSRRMIAMFNKQLQEGTPVNKAATPEKSVKPSVIDLLCSNTPVRENSENSVVEESGESEKKDSVVHCADLAQKPDSEILEVLLYTEADMRRMKQNIMLEMQGILFTKEQQWMLKLEASEREKTRLKEDHAAEYGMLLEDKKILQSKYSSIDQVIEGYEKTIKAVLEDREKLNSKMEKMKEENNQTLQDYQNLESAYSQLHKLYEKRKEVLEGFAKNEETIKKWGQDLQAKLVESEEKKVTLKKLAEEKIARANQEIEKLKTASKMMEAKFQATHKRQEMEIASLHKTLEQKTMENTELTNLCDALIAKVN